MSSSTLSLRCLDIPGLGISGNPTGMSMVLSKWIITPIKVGCKSPK